MASVVARISSRHIDITAVPLDAWAWDNRTPGEMRVWLRTN